MTQAGENQKRCESCRRTFHPRELQYCTNCDIYLCTKCKKWHTCGGYD